MDSDIPKGFRSATESNPFETFVGPLYEKWNSAKCISGFMAADHHGNRSGEVHGGMLFTFADHTLGNLAWIKNKNRPCATITLNMDYFSGARAGDWIVCTGTITKETRSLFFIRGQLTIDEQIIATTSGIWKKLGTD